MTRWIVTVKLSRGYAGPHDPKNKVTGPCPYSSVCTDMTGEHHSFVTEDISQTIANLTEEGVHVTRIEEVS